MTEDHYYYLQKEWVIVFLLILFLTISFLIGAFVKMKSDKTEKKELIQAYKDVISGKDLNLKEFSHLNEKQQLEFQKKESDLKVASQNWAMTEFERYKAAELENQKKIIEENALEKAKIQLQEWKVQHTSLIRQSAAMKSYSVVLGKVTEHLLPFHPNFPFNPQDGRFIGGPIDLIVFDGITEGDKDVTIFFVEIKTGKSKFNDRQIKVMEAIKAGRVEWYPIRETDFIS